MITDYLLVFLIGWAVGAAVNDWSWETRYWRIRKGGRAEHYRPKRKH